MSQLSTVDITILKVPAVKGRQPYRVYYYQGNIFMPVDVNLKKNDVVRVAVGRFLRANKELVASDRASPDYRTLMELADATPSQ